MYCYLRAIDFLYQQFLFSDNIGKPQLYWIDKQGATKKRWRTSLSERFPISVYSNRSCCSGPNADCEGLKKGFTLCSSVVTRLTFVARLTSTTSDLLTVFFLAEIACLLITGASFLAPYEVWQFCL